MTPLPNPFYLVTVAHRAGAYTPERNLTDIGRAETIDDIATGQFEGVVQVIECDIAAGTSRDVTNEIAREVMTRWAIDGEPLTCDQIDFVEQCVSIGAANAFARVA